MPRIVAALAKMGAEVNNRDSGEGYAVHAAAKVGKGFSPLIAAIENGYVDVVRLLIQDLGANPKKKWVTPAGSLGEYLISGKVKNFRFRKEKLL